MVAHTVKRDGKVDFLAGASATVCNGTVLSIARKRGWGVRYLVRTGEQAFCFKPDVTCEDVGGRGLSPTRRGDVVVVACVTCYGYGQVGRVTLAERLR